MENILEVIKSNFDEDIYICTIYENSHSWYFVLCDMYGNPYFCEAFEVSKFKNDDFIQDDFIQEDYIHFVDVPEQYWSYVEKVTRRIKENKKIMDYLYSDDDIIYFAVSHILSHEFKHEFELQEFFEVCLGFVYLLSVYCKNFNMDDLSTMYDNKIISKFLSHSIKEKRLLSRELILNKLV